MLPDIDFREIRGHGPLGSKADGFEELATELLEESLVSWPQGTRFERFGNPDGGREGRAVLPSGETWAWQAKYLFELDASAYAQIGQSVRRAISQEPQLTKYFILCPYDMPAGDTDAARSAHTRWQEHASRWTSEAKTAGRAIDFEYVGLHSLVTALTRAENAGRVRYWFDTASFSPDWFSTITSRAAANAGPRYTPELHVGLPISGVFDALGRTAAFEHTLRSFLGKIRSARKFGFRSPDGQTEHFDSLIAASAIALGSLESVLADAIAAARGVGPLPDPREALSDAEASLQALEGQLYRRCLLRDRDYFIGDAAMLYSTVRDTARAVLEARQFMHGASWAAAERGVLLLIGDAGSGKTHLMCDVAERRTQNGLPTVMLLGEQFDNRASLTQVAELVGFDGSPAEFLAALDAAARAVGDVGLIMIDALNEGADSRMWERSLSGFIQDVIRHPHLKLALSCRTQFVDYVVPETVRKSSAPVVHRGFAEAPDAALARYLDAYGIERPSFPMLEPEFTNPLFLKLVCTTLHNQGATQFPREGVGLTWLYEAHLDAVDAKLSVGDRCDYDARDRLARRAVQVIAAEMAASGPSLPRQKARELVDALLPSRGWATSLFKGLLDEGVLSASLDGDEDSIHFGYQRLGDVAVATTISGQPRDQAVAECGRLARRWWRSAGWLEALAVALPDAHQVELVDVLADEGGEVPYQALDDFIASLAWRTRESVSDRTIEVVRELLADPDHREDTYAALVQLATIPGQPLNADWLHQELMRTPLPDRDASWTLFCNGDTSERGPVEMLIDWAWSGASAGADNEVRRLAAVSLAWFLASSSRPVRDTATKALVHLLEGHPESLTSVLRSFSEVDDPYVWERLLAAACGVALRSHDAYERIAVGNCVAEVTVLAGRWPENLLSRDYARRAVRAAAGSGWDPGPELLSAVDPPYPSDWPVAARSEKEIERLSSAPDYPYGSIRSSLFTWGDFARYVIDPEVGRFAGLEENGTRLVARRVFDRVLELGWAPEQIGWYDRHRRWEPSSGNLIERIGKKYQWIAFRETLGRLADRNQVGGRYTDDPLRPYDDPSDIGARDIDPTVIVRESLHAGWADSPVTWFSPVKADFAPLPFNEWIEGVAGLPDPLALIGPTDDQGNIWLTMEGHYQWSEEQEPDEEALQRPYRRVWYQVRSYLLPATSAAAVEAWAAGQVWTGRWMPEAAEFHGVLLADHPHHSSWRSWTREGNSWGRREAPGPLEVTTAWYQGSGTDYDQSSPDSVRGLVPSMALFDLLQLSHLRDFEWTDGSDMIVATDPAVREFGPASLLVRGADFVQAAGSSAVHVLWTVLGEKQLITRELAGPTDDERRWLEVSATYVLDGQRLRCLRSTARRRQAGEKTIGELHWPLQDQGSAT